MHLRHIRPRSVEWYDALETEGGARAIVARLPDEAVQLRTLREMEGMPERKPSPRDRGRNYDS
jgi:hypothetical protein